MKKHYWFDNKAYQDRLRLAGILIWIILGIYTFLDSLIVKKTVQTPFLILPVNMIALTLVHWYLQKKPRNNSWQDRQLLIVSALLLISFTALWVYEI